MGRLVRGIRHRDRLRRLGEAGEAGLMPSGMVRMSRHLVLLVGELVRIGHQETQTCPK